MAEENNSGQNLVTAALDTLTNQVARTAYFAKLAAYGHRVQEADVPRLLDLGDVVTNSCLAVAQAAAAQPTPGIKAAADAILGTPRSAPSQPAIPAADYLQLPGVKEAAFTLLAARVMAQQNTEG